MAIEPRDTPTRPLSTDIAAQVKAWSQQHWAPAKGPQGSQQASTPPSEGHEGPAGAGGREEVDEALVAQIYAGLSSSTLLQHLELSRYLENYLWPRFPLQAPSRPHLFSVLALIVEKARQHLPVWDELVEDHARVGALFQALWPLAWRWDELGMPERILYMAFLQTAFQSLENDHINRHILRMIALPSWVHVPAVQRDKLLAPHPRLLKSWRHVQQTSARPPTARKKARGATGEESSSPSTSTSTDTSQQYEMHWAWQLLLQFRAFLQAKEETREAREGAQEDGRAWEGLESLYAEKVIEWCGDLLAQLPTRRFFRPLLAASLVLPAARLSSLHAPASPMFTALVARLTRYEHYALDDWTGAALTRDELTERHYERLQTLQVLAFKFFSPPLRAFALRNVGAIEERPALHAQLHSLSDEHLTRLLVLLGFLPSSSSSSSLEDVGTHDDNGDDDDDDHSMQDDGDDHGNDGKASSTLPPASPSALTPMTPPAPSRALLLETMLLAYARRPDRREELVELPVYPHEGLLWAPTPQSASEWGGIRCTALPKLNLQFLTLYDYLERNYTLYQQEALHTIRTDLEDVVERLAPRQLPGQPSATRMTGWARMGAPLQRLTLDSVRKPLLGETAPAHVHATLEVDLQPMRDDVRREWAQVKPSDVLLLLQIRSPLAPDASPDRALPFPQAFGIQAVRGCTVLPSSSSSSKHRGMEDKHEGTGKSKSHTRLTWRVALDPHQYYVDVREDREALYEDAHSLNVVVRRPGKKNAFKGVLQSVRALMGEDSVALPEWLQDVFLGYGDPTTASSLPLPSSFSWADTFLDLPHLHEALPQFQIHVDHKEDKEDKEEDKDPSPSPITPTPISTRVHYQADLEGESGMRVHAQRLPRQSPYAQDHKVGNQIRFTPAQTQALLSGLREGLSVIVGPPGTGKTDVAVQLLHLLYHNHPRQRTLLLTHSPQALDQLFAKLLALPLEARHLLRLGPSSSSSSSAEGGDQPSFTQAGRVDSLLARRAHLLQRVEQLARSLGESPDVAYSCETAHLFYQHTLQPLWAQFQRACAQDTSPDAIRVHFPLSEFFSDAHPPGQSQLFLGEVRATDEAWAGVCQRYLQGLFAELEDIRPFELLRTTRERTQYLLVKQARIVAMTCTQAALRREELAQWGFQVDNVLMEEAGQVLDLETFLPALYGQPRARASPHRLRRLVLLGDHHQLPPLLTNPLLASHARLDQSLFARLVRLGVPTVHLDQQGRCRPALADLYRWQYPALGDLPGVREGAAFQRANAGLVYEYQLVDVGEYHGQGESEPRPHYYQNLGEAEYVVALYQYLRLRGHPASSITLLTPYQGQKALLHDVVRQRCAHNAFGYPHKITTVDRYQGQQNDVVLLSLVRTKQVGHIRDARRLVVAMSRARLGLYVFGRWDVLAACEELAPVMRLMATRPRQLQLLPEESVPTTRAVNDHPAHATSVPDLLAMVELTQRMAQQRFSMPSLTASQ